MHSAHIHALEIPSRVTTRPQWFTCTARGLGIILFFLYLLLIPIRFEHDIIASMIVYCFGAFMLFLGIGILSAGLYMRKNIQASLNAPASEHADRGILYAHENLMFAITISGSYIPPCTSLICRLVFTHDEVTIPILISIPSFGSEHKIFFPLRFPHRGAWTVERVTWELHDMFGLWKWTLTQQDPSHIPSFLVSPLPTHTSGAPVINSCIREGDAISDVRSEKGDLFDLKRYHPSDGMKKIVWKIFARSGQLLSRHPERTMTPEGKVLIIVWANKEEDSAASLAIHYCRYIEETGLEFAVVCRGMEPSEPARTSQEVEELLIKSAWSSDEQSLKNADSLVNRLLETTRGTQEQASHIVVIGSTADKQVHSVQELETLGEMLSARGIHPVFLIASLPVQHTTDPREKSSSATDALKDVFFTNTKAESPQYDLKDFPRRAVYHRWDIHEVMP